MLGDDLKAHCQVGGILNNCLVRNHSQLGSSYFPEVSGILVKLIFNSFFRIVMAELCNLLSKIIIKIKAL